MIDEPENSEAETLETESEPAPEAEAPKATKKPGPKPKAEKAPKAAKAAKPKAEKPQAEIEAADIPHGTALLDHDDPDASASFNGIELARGKKGLFLVPLSAVEHLIPHGFRLIGAGE